MFVPEKYLEADVRLYKHFKHKFNQQIKMLQVSKLKSEIRALQHDTHQAKVSLLNFILFLFKFKLEMDY